MPSILVYKYVTSELSFPILNFQGNMYILHFCVIIMQPTIVWWRIVKKNLVFYLINTVLCELLSPKCTEVSRTYNICIIYWVSEKKESKQKIHTWQYIRHKNPDFQYNDWAGHFFVSSYHLCCNRGTICSLTHIKTILNLCINWTMKRVWFDYWHVQIYVFFTASRASM
jgi:hypothetical protein